MLINKNTFAFKAKIDSYAIFRHLELFIKIVECNSFSGAARKLNVTPSSVSRGLQQLEEQLGGPLFGVVSCLIPCYLVYRVPVLHKFKGATVWFIIFFGVLLCLSPFFKFFE